MHFTQTHLMALSDNGTYRLYDLSNPQSFQQYSLGSEISELGIISAKAHDDGFVVLTGGLQFMEIRGWSGGRVGALASAGKAQFWLRRLRGRLLICSVGIQTPPHSWTIIPPDQSSSGHVEILVSNDTSIISIDALERIDQSINRGPFSHILLSPNGRFIALITAAGVLWVVSSDFARSLSEVRIAELGEDDGEVLGVPERVEWCGDNALVLAWGGKVLVVGPNGDRLRSVRSEAQDDI
jgi:hypothetical protein